MVFKENNVSGSIERGKTILGRKYDIKNRPVKNKKALEFLEGVRKLKYKAKVLSDLRFITNEIMSNACYHEKNIEEQFKRIEKLNVPKYEKDLLARAWDLKYNLSQSLLRDLEVFLDESEKGYNIKK